MEHSKRKWRTLSMAFVGLFVVAVPLVSHHGTAVSYEMDTHIEVTGVVTEWVFRNPHVQFHIDVTDENGEVVPWVVEGGGLYFWARAGWDRNSVKPGDEIVVTLSPSKAGTPVGVMSKIVLPSGRKACSINPRAGDQDC